MTRSAQTHETNMASKTIQLSSQIGKSDDFRSTTQHRDQHGVIEWQVNKHKSDQIPSTQIHLTPEKKRQKPLLSQD